MPIVVVSQKFVGGRDPSDAVEFKSQSRSPMLVPLEMLLRTCDIVSQACSFLIF